jgi:hypothetical protein
MSRRDGAAAWPGVPAVPLGGAELQAPRLPRLLGDLSARLGDQAPREPCRVRREDVPGDPDGLQRGEAAMGHVEAPAGRARLLRGARRSPRARHALEQPKPSLLAYANGALITLSIAASCAVWPARAAFASFVQVASP